MKKLLLIPLLIPMALILTGFAGVINRAATVRQLNVVTNNLAAVSNRVDVNTANITTNAANAITIKTNYPAFDPETAYDWQVREQLALLINIARSNSTNAVPTP